LQAESAYKVTVTVVVGNAVVEGAAVMAGAAAVKAVKLQLNTMALFGPLSRHLSVSVGTESTILEAHAASE
jgi:hypothetical protein